MNPLVAPEAFARDSRTALSVNVNKIALLRNSRHLDIPNVVSLSRIALEAGAHGITVHPRPDQRHIRPHDVHDLAALLRDWPRAEYNIEGNPSHNLMQFVRELKPHQCTLVPDSESQFTSDHGYDLPADGAALRPLVDELRSLGVRVSLFMDPLPDAMRHAAELGVDRVELYTEPYAQAHGTPAQAEVLRRYAAAAQAAQSVGLGVNAGHDLNRRNLTDFLHAVPGVLEVSIGHALVADAIELGLAATVRAYQRCIDQAQAVPAR
ncbi:MAG TPA: pyridoxine 5'-phosphate synthase [Burkholderiaceae bacterium]|nr:pyridoxine 5'-phosphate synthase [Burkholderiaceae bacterium]